MSEGVARHHEKVGRQEIRVQGQIHRYGIIDKLPDNVLLEIFDLYRVAITKSFLASPKRLDLRLLCTNGTPVRKALDYWPQTLPIIIDYPNRVESIHPTPEAEDNIIAALGKADRVSRIYVVVTCSLWQKLLAAMQRAFVSLTYLRLVSLDSDVPPLLSPGELLGGSAPVLREVSLDGIPFAALSRLVLSTDSLVSLRLWRIPNSGNISPEAVVMCLSSLARLELFDIKFNSPIPHPNRPPTASTRVVLPVLTKFNFQGVSEYLEDLVARIDIPHLERADITFFNQLIFDIPQLSLFSHRTKALRLPTRAKMYSCPDDVTFSFNLPGTTDPSESMFLRILCKELDWQVSAMTEICNQLPLSSVGHLETHVNYRKPGLQDGMEPAQWLELLQPFNAVKTLEVSGAAPVVSLLALALEGVARGTMVNVLPSLRTLSFAGSQKLITVKEFITARQLLGHPVEVHYG
ncbi:hypothetical protein BC827DRAFT_1269866 [Russula dissimulans]|nr:hypothetical protein BC827DRAFT_1269866 [Russula dissimulans]